MMVYVLFEYDPQRAGPKKEHPVGVVTEESVAEAFYNADHKNRDYVPFILDEVPEFTGKPSSFELPPEPEKSAPKYDPQMTKTILDSQKQVQEATDKIRRMMERMKKKPKV